MNISITHDGPIDIATGRNRRETAWRNREIQWSQLVERFNKTHRTHETSVEYQSAKKDVQANLKDVGGFVGAYLAGGRRLKTNVQHRQLLTLDIDYGTSDTWTTFLSKYHNAAAMYSTHSHLPEKPKIRIVVPLTRPVLRDEYEPIARKVAGEIGIEAFKDQTTFRADMLVYWPSTSKDGEFLFDYVDADWLDPDTVLATYHNWQDSSEWPISEGERAEVKTLLKKQADPLEKSGVIGAFCRTYTISDVLEQFLSEDYEPTDVPGRWTYKHGSTAGGLVLYDDKFAYSHHGTDPTSGQLCNAFDLVRLHRFGLQDEDCKPDTPVNKRPSYVAMEKLVDNDVKCNLLKGKEKRADAAKAFQGVTIQQTEPLEDEGQADETWKGKIKYNKHGNADDAISTIEIILQNDPLFKSRFAFDEFQQQVSVRKDLPWRKVDKYSKTFTDTDEQNLYKYLEMYYGISNRRNILSAFIIVVHDNSFHSVRDYLNRAEWDGQKRLESILVEYLGADNSEYVRTVTRKTLVAAVARIMEPGIKFDEMLALVGGQGQGKSTLIDRLGNGEWTSDSFSFNALAKGNLAFEQIQSFWLVEIPELAGYKKTETEMVKAFLSKRKDTYRPRYGRQPVTVYRQCIFIGTTNNRDFLHDITGNRRYWPIQTNPANVIKDVHKDLTPGEVQQIWAEAVVTYKNGETLYLSDEMKKQAGLIQKEHTNEHPWTGIINQFLEQKLPTDWNRKTIMERRIWLDSTDDIREEGAEERSRVCVLEIWCEALKMRMEGIDQRAEAIIRGVLQKTQEWEEIKEPKKFGPYGLLRKGFMHKRVTNAVTSPEKRLQFKN